ncbi:CDF zinc transporter [Fistulina hepatica ATCC 64428]|uniref:CDF zinc transporter n=1 Tax=Fistulina hepatica ATCC 64428 TaxID=1128425 RepID=A0A0D7AJT7_9AGAR|nr:CDF zinc transporter [Fistulina hepatica ATCC 64428]
MLKNTTRLGIVLAISFSFFVAEIAVGFRTKSLALIADAFHYLNDIVAYCLSFTIGHVYLLSSGLQKSGFTFAFHRAELVGAFFNGVFLLALALSIALQSIGRFINIETIKTPVLVLIIGCVGLSLNVLSVLVVHDHHGHDHGGSGHERSVQDADVISEEVRIVHEGHHHTLVQPSAHAHRNLGLLGVLIHLCGDAVNNIGVIVAALIIWKVDSPNRYYADPAASLLISMIIFASAIPLTIKSSRILLEAAPTDLDLENVKDDLVKIPGVLAIHDLHVWHLSQSVVLASVHVCVALGMSLQEWEKIEECLQHCFSEYGVGHVTISPELHRNSPELQDGDEHALPSDPSSQTASQPFDEDDLVGTCKMPFKDGFGCSSSELIGGKAATRRRKTAGSV